MDGTEMIIIPQDRRTHWSEAEIQEVYEKLGIADDEQRRRLRQLASLRTPSGIPQFTLSPRTDPETPTLSDGTSVPSPGV